MTVPSTTPLLMSTFVMAWLLKSIAPVDWKAAIVVAVNEVNVPAAALLVPITVPSTLTEVPATPTRPVPPTSPGTSPS